MRQAIVTFRSRRFGSFAGGVLILAAVGTVVLAILLAVADLSSFLAGRGYADVVLSVAFALLGAGFAVLGMERRAAYRSTLGRRGAKIFAAGLLLDGAILGLGSTGLKGSELSIVILPLIVAAWTTVIGFGLTILALFLTPGPGPRVGLLFVAAILALAASNAFTNMLGEITRLIGLALGAVAGFGLLAGFAGVGVISIRDSGLAESPSAQ